MNNIFLNMALQSLLLVAMAGLAVFFRRPFFPLCLVASAVIRAKRQHPQIALVLLLPYHPAERPIEKPKGFDSTYYPPDMEKVPRRLAIVRANRYVVDHVDYLIAYAWHSASNARELAEYAQKRERKGLITVTML